jgi:hypothetical protein
MDSNTDNRCTPDSPMGRKRPASHTGDDDAVIMPGSTAATPTGSSSSKQQAKQQAKRKLSLSLKKHKVWRRLLCCSWLKLIFGTQD